MAPPIALSNSATASAVSLSDCFSSFSLPATPSNPSTSLIFAAPETIPDATRINPSPTNAMIPAMEASPDLTAWNVMFSAWNAPFKPVPTPESFSNPPETLSISQPKSNSLTKRMTASAPLAKVSAIALPSASTFPLFTRSEITAASSLTLSFSGSRMGAPIFPLKVSHALESSSKAPRRLFPISSAWVVAKPVAPLSLLFSSSTASIPCPTSARKAGPAASPSALMAACPFGPVAASSRIAWLKSLVRIPMEASSRRKVLAGFWNWLIIVAIAVPARLPSKPASASLPM